MGRPETPIREGCAQAPLALWLRAQRRRAGLTYAEMANKTDHAPRTLRRAASGEALPKLQLVLDFAAACGADTAEANKHWQRARARQARADGRARESMFPQYISNFADLRIAMVELRARVGNPPFRKLEERAGPGQLPRSTVSLVLRGRAPLREELLVAFVRACGVRDREIDAWRNAWKAAAAHASAWERRRQEELRDVVRIVKSWPSDPERHGSRPAPYLLEPSPHPHLSGAVPTFKPVDLIGVQEGMLALAEALPKAVKPADLIGVKHGMLALAEALPKTVKPVDLIGLQQAMLVLAEALPKAVKPADLIGVRQGMLALAETLPSAVARTGLSRSRRPTGPGSPRSESTRAG